MEEVENYTSLHEFTEDMSCRGNKPILNNHNAQELKRGSECLRGQTALFVLIGLLASICANIALSVLLFSRPLPSVPLEAASLTLKLNSVRGRYVRLCDDYSKLGQSCSKTVKKCRECPEGWIHVDEKCYSFSNDKMDWPSSRDSCTSLGSHLTILHSKEQHDALEKEARRIGGFDYHFWIGLSDREKEGDWRWVDNTTLTNKYVKPIRNNPLSRVIIRGRQIVTFLHSLIPLLPFSIVIFLLLLSFSSLVPYFSTSFPNCLPPFVSGLSISLSLPYSLSPLPPLFLSLNPSVSLSLHLSLSLLSSLPVSLSGIGMSIALSLTITSQEDHMGKTVPPWTAIRRPGLTCRVTTSTNAFVRWMPSG
uniref:C-type lectin domain-containing protein n=1 Tax=Oncorhynchus tshawytscha TaxID=74940 RepID=A0AAZ3QWU7_ONCTS